MMKVIERPALVGAPVRDVMGASFPVVGIDASVEEVLRLMRVKENYAVLVEEAGSINGILNRYDVMEYLAR
jgi:predicted transcriptional regulator